MSSYEPHINYKHLDDLSIFARQSFMSAKPYEHIIIDNFLHEKSYAAILSNLPSPNENKHSSDYIFAKNKFENPLFDADNKILGELRQELIGERFSGFLKLLYDKDIFIDHEFIGGGIHHGGSGSFLDMHADFSRHPVRKDWLRELNILLYLNEGYRESWGGHLEMQNMYTNMTGRIAPCGNRMVIMRTKEYTLHGYKPIKFPTGRYRISIASYAYSINSDFDSIPDHSTLWKPNAISKQLVAQAMPLLIKLKTKVFGSSTVKRSKR